MTLVHPGTLSQKAGLKGVVLLLKCTSENSKIVVFAIYQIQKQLYGAIKRTLGYISPAKEIQEDIWK